MASKKGGVNPLLVGLGLVAGAAGAAFLSKKENRTKAKKLVKTAQKNGGSWLLEAAQTLQNLSTDMDALNGQKEIDTEKKKTAKRRKK